MFVQFSGINGVLYYTPQILEEAGVEVLLSDIGIGSESASFLISAFTTFLMLPCIGVAMKLMDVSGRRYACSLFFTLICSFLDVSLFTFLVACIQGSLLFHAFDKVIINTELD